MSKNLFASEDVMDEYLSALLTEEPIAVKKPVVPQQRVLVEELEVEKPKSKAEQSLKPVADLLAEASQRQHDVLAEPVVDKVVTPVIEEIPTKTFEPELDTLTTTETTVDVELEQAEQTPPPNVTVPEAYREGDFQALYFNVSGLTIAVPLTELGGIHNIDKPNPLFGKPDWFMGVMLHREDKLNVVDTARWVMPEKYDEELEKTLNYQYVIMLGNSKWGLACESLVNTLTLSQEDVKWRESLGKRPWLAGLVKEKMCALLNVKQLIELLDQGLGS